MTRQLHYVNELTQNSGLVHWALELSVVVFHDISLFMTHCTLLLPSDRRGLRFFMISNRI